MDEIEARRRSKKIVIATLGSRGDVQPYINLSQGLLEAGYRVVLATNPTLKELVEGHGVPCVTVGPPVDMGEEGARLLAQSFNNMWLGLIRVMSLAARLIEESFPEVVKVIEDADLVISSDSASGIAEAEKLGKPWVSVTLQPGRIPAPNQTLNPAARLIWSIFGSLMIAPTNRFRRRVGSPPAKDIIDLMSKRMILLPVSRHVVQVDPRWPSYVYPTGYWFPRGAKEWTPPQDLLNFLEAGERPIAVSLGVMSMSGQQARQGAQIVLQALRDTKVRAIIQGWDQALQGIDLPKTIYHAGSLPHAWLFDQVGAVVHHGGFGTTASVLRSGVPGIIVPNIIDQFYWGQHVFELGAGPNFIPRGKLNARRLAEAISQALSDDKMRRRAAELGDCIRNDPDGVKTAVSYVDQAVL